MKLKIVLLLVLLLAGCQTLSQEKWHVDVASNREGYQLRDVRMREESGQWVVSGIVQSDALMGPPPKGLVIVTVHTSDHPTPTIVRLDSLQRLSKRHHKRVERLRFQARFDAVPPPGSKVMIRFDSTDDDSTTTVYRL